MARASHLSSAKNINPLQTPLYPTTPNCSFPQSTKIICSKKHNEGVGPLITKRASRAPRRMVTIPASSGKWPGKWTCEYIITLKDLQLGDLAHDGRTDTEVYVSLSLQKHTGFGLSVDGKVITSIMRKCSSCSSPFCRKIETGICVWVLPEGRDNPSTQMPEIGGDDPSVIYVKPGYEADLDSLVQDTIRLQTAVKETCSESCEKSEPKLHYIGDQWTASLDRRWSRLLQLRNLPSGTTKKQDKSRHCH